MMFDGKRLSEKELKYLALTSHELNMFLDREQYQKYVDLLSPEFINKLEINIGEYILESYQEAREIVSKKREEYLKRKNSKMRTQLFNKDDAIHVPRTYAQLELDRKHQQLTKKAFIQKYFTDAEGNVTKYPLSLKTGKTGVKGILMKARNLVNCLLNSSTTDIDPRQTGKVRRPYSVDLKKHKMKVSIYGDFLEEDYYRLKHPESKIIPLSQANQHASLAKAILHDQEANRTKTFGKKPPGTLKKFFKVYSSGPSNNNRPQAKVCKFQSEENHQVHEDDELRYFIRKDQDVWSREDQF
jgi:hypothetical protein